MNEEMERIKNHNKELRRNNIEYKHFNEFITNELNEERKNVTVLERAIDRAIAYMYGCNGELDYSQTKKAIDILKGSEDNEE